MKKKIFTAVFAMIFITGLLVGCAGDFDNISKKISTYTIAAVFDEQENILNATQEVEYINSTDVVLNEVDFHLYPNAFSEQAQNKPVNLNNSQTAYYNGINYGYIIIQHVFVENNEITFSIGGEDNNILVVPVVELYPNDSVSIKMEYEVKLPNIKHRFGYGENVYNFGNFYPIACVYENGGFMTSPYSSNGDPFYSDMANYNVTLKFNSEFVAAHTGAWKKTETKDGITTLNIEAKVVRDFAFVLSKHFEMVSEKWGSTTVNYYYYDDPNYMQGLKAGVDALKTFSELFGEYPYSTLSIVKTNFIHGGMEYPNLVYISDAVSSQQEYINVIIHEVAHQWWYNLVGSNAYTSAWQDEGLTEFSTMLFYENNPSYNVDVNARLNSALSSYLLFLDIYSSVYTDTNTRMDRALNEYNGEMDYTYTTYVRGMLFFRDIRDIIGGKDFIAALKFYYKENCFKIASPADLIYAFEKISHKNLEAYMMSWIEGREVLVAR
ncbi:MAG: M1 family metallopeptidase [Christensenellaceae bacterium]|jgi:hypothetical protein|nr:M1 family metallopeptidase [Christensenellaceae bacterium]